MEPASFMEANTLAADLSKLSYFSLPGEIRNKVIGYVLASGNIYPCRRVSETSRRGPDAMANVEPGPGVQLMATCKQAYRKGHELFYVFLQYISPTADRRLLVAR